MQFNTQFRIFSKWLFKRENLHHYSMKVLLLHLDKTSQNSDGLFKDPDFVPTLNIHHDNASLRESPKKLSYLCDQNTTRVLVVIVDFKQAKRGRRKLMEATVLSSASTSKPASRKGLLGFSLLVLQSPDQRAKTLRWKTRYKEGCWWWWSLRDRHRGWRLPFLAR